jgi:DNA-binding CsgD family transcriptional regulator
MQHLTSDTIVKPYKNGICTMRPSSDKAEHSFRISHLDNMSVPTYFLNTESRMTHVNEPLMRLVGMQSIRDTLGKTARNFCRRDFAELCLTNDKSVVSNQNMRLMEETGFRQSDGALIQVLSFKLPWYQDEKLAGLLGWSIQNDPASMPNIAVTLSQLLATGLLGNTKIPCITTPVSNNPIAGVYFSTREISIMRLIIRGKTIREIGNVLHLSPRTIENYFAFMKEKVGAKSKSHFIELMI